MTGKKIMKVLKKHGWYLERITGSHHIFYKEGFRSIAVPVHGKKDLGPGLLKAIFRQAGLEKDEL
ncbi:type II toxin-antitoxin system HicA family toxin [Oceanispirochaeta sp.]|jgi:predicted RNA binding protein YcfA (HicA-like mRNA interferase family)|uniref:type II toxin-antitoxin system HicA family toxin n=1 Tax=Oceanispirochaeta sp. TaxID=2035350 RepID=UPI00261BCC1C|nr:type II toxin-antitoxin system HicA family toxin [Oceanispirochaeta sp.]MDA3957891.1 type II toxin-antitoxin system HicA family toxin [Oceanispirochaeta sp.]